MLVIGFATVGRRAVLWEVNITVIRCDGRVEKARANTLVCFWSRLVTPKLRWNRRFYTTNFYSPKVGPI